MTTTDAFAQRLFDAAIGTVDLFMIYLGDRLGFYRVLLDEAATPGELAARAGTDPRYTREWLEQQAVTGILEVEDADADPDARRYSLPASVAPVLTDPDHLATMTWMSRFMVGAAQALPKVLEAFRAGGGVSWSAYGPDVIEAQGDQNRPVFLNLLTKEWLPAIPDVHERLLGGDARVADVACGVGWSSIAIARDFPSARVDGFDLDAHSIMIAKQLAAEAGVADRTSFDVRDVADPGLRGAYDLVLALECIHDLSRPVEVLAAMREMAAPGGAVIVMDERVGDRFTAPGDEVERLMYGYSLLFCLPSGMAEQPSAATGTVMRTEQLAGYARAAGFSDVDVLPIEHDFFRFYRLRV